MVKNVNFFNSKLLYEYCFVQGCSQGGAQEGRAWSRPLNRMLFRTAKTRALASPGPGG